MSWETKFAQTLGGDAAMNSMERHMIDFVAKLFDAGWNPNVMDTNWDPNINKGDQWDSYEVLKLGTTPIWARVLADKDTPVSVVSTLLDKGAVIPADTEKARSLLLIALSAGVNPDIISLLLYHGAMISFLEDEGNTVLMYAFQSECGLETIQLLVEAGASATKKMKGGSFPLHLAVVNDASLEVLSYLLNQRADINAVDEKGNTVLFEAIDNLKQLEYLLSCGAEVNVINKEGYSPLLEICKSSMATSVSDKVEALVQGGATMYEICEGKTLLMIASECGNTPAVTKLLGMGFSKINAVHEETGKTALHFACENYNRDLVIALLEYGADHTLEDKEGNTLVDLVTDEDERAEFITLI